MTKMAGIQMASGPNVGANLVEATRLIGDAAQAGARMIVLPENFALMGMRETDKVEAREQPGSGPIQEFLSQQAKRFGVWLVGGTIPMESEDENKIRASCLLFNDQGEQVARYDKMHLFDVELAGGTENYTESETIQAGHEPVVVNTPLGRLGLAVCYDLRFPELFRSLLDAGMQVLALPSAFTAITGKAHWETLVRARAIENLAYVVAAAQGGFHASGRETHGHSMIVEPWGGIVDCLPRGSGFVMGSIDRGRLENTRRTFPALDHRRLHCR